MFYVAKTKECKGKNKKKQQKNNICPFLFLENSRPLSPWGPPDFLSTCLGIASLNIMQVQNQSLQLHISLNFEPWVPCFLHLSSSPVVILSYDIIWQD